MSDAQLLSYFSRLEKILNETKIYTKLMAREGLAPNYYDEDELLFPIEIGHEMYNKTLKVYLESKSYIDSIEKTLNKCVDSLGKNEKTSHLINSKFSNSNSNSNNNNNNSSSSSDDEPSTKNDQVGQKRKSKKMAPGSSKVNKRPKQPPPSSDREDSGNNSGNNSTTTSTSTSTKDKSNEKEREKSSSSSEKESNGSHTPLSKEKSLNTTPNKEPSSSLNGSGGLNGGGNSNSNSNSNSSGNSGGGSSGSGNNNNGNNSSGNNSNGFHGIQSGQLVAARDTKSNQWILAKVNSFSVKTQKYEVIDEDEEEPKRFSVGQKDIIQLPSLSNLPPTFPINTKVLAMFPDTTAFYPAVVVNVQKVKGKPTSYHLHFEDDQDNNGETPNRRVNAQHVISLNK